MKKIKDYCLQQIDYNNKVLNQGWGEEEIARAKDRTFILSGVIAEIERAQADNKKYKKIRKSLSF